MIYGLLAPRGLRRKPRALLQTLTNSARRRGYQLKVFTEYEPCEFLILYGWGGAKQQEAIEKHKGRYVAFDLGYWNRAGYRDRKWRVSIDGFHCPDLINVGPVNPQRLRDDRISVGSDSSREGPILLIGNAPKSIKIIENNWSAKMAKAIRHHFPDRKIIYRPKPGRPAEVGVDHDGVSGGPIDDAIRKASLVVCRHSNVAVDCCINGVPVVCQDGAASAIYPNRLEDYKDQPTRVQRQEFLERLAWWQWSINEIHAGKFWPWLESKLV